MGKSGRLKGMEAVDFYFIHQSNSSIASRLQQLEQRALTHEYTNIPNSSVYNLVILTDPFCYLCSLLQSIRLPNLVVTTRFGLDNVLCTVSPIYCDQSTTRDFRMYNLYASNQYILISGSLKLGGQSHLLGLRSVEHLLMRNLAILPCRVCCIFYQVGSVVPHCTIHSSNTPLGGLACPVITGFLSTGLTHSILGQLAQVLLY